MVTEEHVRRVQVYGPLRESIPFRPGLFGHEVILEVIPLPIYPTNAATSAVIILEGVTMGNISVESTTAVASLTWEDDHGDAGAVVPAGAVAAWASDNPAVLTVDASSGAITPLTIGSANVSVTLTDSVTGGPLLLSDGVTPFPTPAPVAVTVTAGPAVAAVITVSE